MEHRFHKKITFTCAQSGITNHGASPVPPSKSHGRGGLVNSHDTGNKNFEAREKERIISMMKFHCPFWLHSIAL